jgi:DNA-binding NarL/FixJ family response regulator
MKSQRKDPLRRRLLVVDDHPIVRQGIRALVEQQGDLKVCGEAGSYREALEAAHGERPDVAIVDISLEGSDGLELTKALRAHYPKMPILVMSMHDESLYAERVLRAGANGYLMKQEVASKVVEAVRCVLAGKVYLSERVGQRILHDTAHPGPAEGLSSIDRLSDRELEVYRLIGCGKKTREIAEVLGLSIKTIETYRAHIKEKLGLRNAIELVRSAAQWVDR